MKLVSLQTKSLMGNQLKSEVQETPSAGRFIVSINEVPFVVNFEENGEANPSSSLWIMDGFDIEILIRKLWQ